MGRSVVSRDARVFAVARAGLTLLVARGQEGAQGKEMFGDAARDGWGRNLLQRMMEKGLVTCLPQEHKRSTRVFVAVEALKNLVADNARLAMLLWPSGTIGVRPADVEAAAKTLAAPDAPVEPWDGDEEEEPVEEESPPSGAGNEIETLLAEVPEDQLLPALVKLCSATLQNVVYMREKVDALTSEIAKLKEAWQ